MTPIKKMLATVLLVAGFFLIDPKPTTVQAGQFSQCTGNHLQMCYWSAAVYCGEWCYPYWYVAPHCIYNDDGDPIMMHCGFFQCMNVYDPYSPCMY